MSDRLLDTNQACAVWGGRICRRTMQRKLEAWYDAGYGIGAIEPTPGGHWRVRESFLVAQRDKNKVGQVGQVGQTHGGKFSTLAV